MVKKFLLITLLILSLPIITKAEDFTIPSRFHYWVYENNTTEIATGDGLFSGSYRDINRVQWVYQMYTYDPNYLYDITFTYEGFHFPFNNLSDLVDSCEIYTGSGEHYTCYVNKEFPSQNVERVSMSIYNMRGTNMQTTWLNFYSSTSKLLQISADKYTLTIIRKQDPYATSEDIQQASDNIINSQNEINNSINDDTSVSNSDLNDTLDDWNDSLSNENALSDFILMPFTILNNISNGLGARCETFSLGTLLNHNIVLPCINIEYYLGSNLWSTIDSLFCIFMIYNIAMLFIQCFEGITTLRDDFDSLYTPQHGDFGYRPRHGGE